MIRTAKEWAEVFAKLAEENPDQLIWCYNYTRHDIEIYNSPEADGYVPQGDWEKVVREFERICDHSALEQVWEAFSDATSSEMGYVRCNDCYEYDYEVKGDDYEKVCANCGEEKDLLDQEPKSD